MRGEYAWQNGLPMLSDINWPYLMVADGRGNLHIFKGDNYAKEQPFIPVESDVASASFTTDGKFLIAGSFNGFISASYAGNLGKDPFAYGYLDDAAISQIVPREENIRILTSEGNLFDCWLRDGV